jgi:hypothetical protein
LYRGHDDFRAGLAIQFSQSGGGHIFKAVEDVKGHSVPEVVVDGETGFLVAPHDPRALADRIVRLLKDPALRTQMGTAALTRARKRFTVERMVEGTVEVYARFATTGHRSTAADSHPSRE